MVFKLYFKNLSEVAEFFEDDIDINKLDYKIKSSYYDDHPSQLSYFDYDHKLNKYYFYYESEDEYRLARNDEKKRAVKEFIKDECPLIACEITEYLDKTIEKLLECKNDIIYNLVDRVRYKYLKEE